MPTLEHVFPSFGTPPPTHLVPVLRVHFQGLNQVTCHLTMTPLGCQVQHGKGVLILLMDPGSKHWQQQFDDIQTPTFCSLMHGIAAFLHRETTKQTRQNKGIKMREAILSCCYAQHNTSRQQYVVVMSCPEGEHTKGQGEAVRT